MLCVVCYKILKICILRYITCWKHFYVSTLHRTRHFIRKVCQIDASNERGLIILRFVQRIYLQLTEDDTYAMYIQNLSFNLPTQVLNLYI